MRRTILAALGVVALLGGCKTGQSSRHPKPDAAASGESEGRERPVEATGDPVVFATVGVPHGAAISLVAIDIGAKAALTRDTAGGVRLWPALDGSREPMVVPVRDPRAMALGSDGADGWILTLIDAAGGARIVAVDPAGKMQPLASVPPTEHIVEAVVLPGGERIVLVSDDHVVRLVDRRAVELARLDQPGLRPASLRVAAQAEGGPRVVAVTAGEFDQGEGRFAVELLPLDLSGDRVELAPSRQTVMLDSPPNVDNPSLSPDGRTVVFVQRQRLGGATWLVTAKQLADGKQTSVDSGLGLGAQPRFGLLSEGRVLLDDGTGLGRVVDLRERDVELVPLRSGPTLNHMATVFGPDLRVAPASTWLAVHELTSDELRYLGYEQITINAAGVSPSARHVAWSLGDRVAVEPLPGGQGGADTLGEVVEVPGTRATNHLYVGFLDEERLVMLDWGGGAKLVRWRDGEILDAADLGSNVQMADLRRHGDGGGVMFVRTNLWQNPMIVELHDNRIGKRYLTYGASNLAGLLAPADAALEHWGGWTIDGAAMLHEFSLTRLRDGVGFETAMTGGEQLSAGVPEHFAPGPDGTRYWVRTSGARPSLFAERGTDSRETVLTSGFVAMMSLSPDGRRLAIVQQRDPGQVLGVYDTNTLQLAWAQPLPATVSLSWSEHGEALAVPASFGGVVLDGADGSPQTARCGLAFEVRQTPPVIQGLFNQLSVCEL